jgi:hypothetical protein
MEDRRKIKRRHLLFYTRIFDRRNGALLGHIADLTLQGAMIISEEPLPLNTTFQMMMDLPYAYNAKNHIDFDALSVWSTPDLDPKFFNTGFKLLNVDKEDTVIIEKIIQDFGFKD